MALHSSTLAWKIPWTEEPGRPQSMGLLRVGDDWATSLSLFTSMHWRGQWPPTPVFLPGESQGRGAWWAAVYGVAQSRTRLQRLGSSSSTKVWVAGIFRTTPQAFPGPTDWQPKALSPYRAITERQKHLTAVKGFLPTVPQVFTQERQAGAGPPGPSLLLRVRFSEGKAGLRKGGEPTSLAVTGMLQVHGLEVIPQLPTHPKATRGPRASRRKAPPENGRWGRKAGEPGQGRYLRGGEWPRNTLPPAAGSTFRKSKSPGGATSHWEKAPEAHG